MNENFTELPFGNERILYHTYMVKPSCKFGTCDRVVIWKLNENFVRLIDKVYEFLFISFDTKNALQLGDAL